MCPTWHDSQTNGRRRLVTRLINLTPHEIHVLRGRARVTLPTAGSALWLDVELTESDDVILGELTIPIFEVTVRGIEQLPELIEGTLYVVSRLVAESYPDRRDFIFPNELVRDANGSVIGCASFGRTGG